jgi:hypothetical protein
MRDEVTRVDGVAYLRGMSAHAAGSSLFLCPTATFAALGRWGAATLTLVVAYGVAANGLSMYAWDEVHARTRATEENEEPDRELTVHRLSPETKADLLAGLVIALGVVAVAVVATAAFRYAGLNVRTAVVLGGGGLAVANVCTLLWQQLTSGSLSGREYG